MTTEIETLLEEARLAMMMGDLDDALEIFDEARAVAEDDRQRSACLAGRAAVLIKRAQYGEAVDVLDAALALAGEEAPASVHGNLAFALDKLSRHDEAVRAHRRCIECHAREDGPLHGRTLRKRGDLAYALIGLGRLDEAEALLRDVVDGFAREPAREPVWFTQALVNLGYFLLRSRQDPEAALRVFDRAEAMRAQCSIAGGGGEVGGFPPELEAVLLENRAEACDALGRAPEASELRRRATSLRAARAASP